MKKIHGTYSIQPGSITDIAIADDAAIAESKLNLTFSTANIQNDVNALTNQVNAHINLDHDPHGTTLYQTTLETENIQSSPSSSQRTITVSNPDDGDVLFSVEGDISAVNASFSGDTNIAGITTIGGQTHITGNVVIDGDLSVVGNTTTVASNTIDYDSLLVTPSTAVNRTGIIVAPDGTGFEDDGQSQTTTETITVHDDIVDAADGWFMSPIKELSNGDLIITLSNRIVKTNPTATEIKATYFITDENAQHVVTDGYFQWTVVNDSDEISVVVQDINNDEGSLFTIRTLDSDLELIRETGVLFENSDPSLNNIDALEYHNGVYYALYFMSDSSHKLCMYDETLTAKYTDEEYPNNFSSYSTRYEIYGLHGDQSEATELEDLAIRRIVPFTHEDQDYLFILTAGNMFIIDKNMHLQGYEMWDESSEDYDLSAVQDTVMSSTPDPASKRLYMLQGCFIAGFPFEYFLNAQTYVSEEGFDYDDMVSTMPTVFDDAYSSMEDLSSEDTYFGFITGTLHDGTLLYYSHDSYNIYWLDSSRFSNVPPEIIAGGSMLPEFSPGLEADFVTHVRRFIVTDEDEENAASGGSEEPEEIDPFVMNSEAEPLSSYGLDNYGAVVMTTDPDGNFYFVGSSTNADCITKVDAETLSSASIRIYNAVTEGEYMFGEHGVYGLSISTDKSAAYIACSSMTAETGPTAVYRYDLRTGICDPNIRSDAYLQGGYTNGSVGPYRNIGFNAYTVDYANNRMVLIGGTTDQENDLGGILLLDPEDYSTIKYIKITGAHPYVYSDRWDIHLCVSHDGNYAYVIEFYNENGQYGDPKKTALSKIPLNTQVTSYDPANSPDCVEVSLYSTEDIATYGYPVAIGITPEDRLFVATVSGHVFELDSDTLEVVDEADLLNSDELASKYQATSMAVNSDTMLVGYVNLDNNWELENYELRAYDISNDTLVSEATVTESVPYDGPTPSAPNVSEDPGESEDDYYGRDLIRTTTQEIEVETSTGDTFLGNLLELQKRTRGFNEAAVIVDKSGTLKLLTGGLEVGNVKGAVNNNVLLFDKGLGASLLKATNDGFVYRPSSDNQPNNKAFDIQDASGVSNAFITKNGDATVNSLSIGVSSAITEVGTGLVIPNDINISSSELLLDDSTLTFAAENKNEWKVLNRNSTISFYYDTESTPQVELGDNLFDLSNCETTKTDDLIVTGDATFNGSINMAANMTVDGIKVGSHDHTGGDMGTVLPQTAVTGLKTFVDNINTTIKNCVNEMTSSNTESGIDVAYNSNTGKLDLSVNDFTLTLSGDASGSATIQHASDTTLSVTVLDSAKLGGLSLPSTTANTEANKVLRTDSNGKTTVKALLMSSPTAAGTAALGKIYASAGSETEIKSYTPANFATQLLALGGTAKNSHTHTAVNGLTPVRGSSTFNGVSGRVIMLSASRANTNYSVAVTPSAAPNGHLGEIWVIKGTDRFTVYNSGSATSAFDYIMLG